MKTNLNELLTELRDNMLRVADTFQIYGKLHAAKPRTPENIEKTARNIALARLVEADVIKINKALAESNTGLVSTKELKQQLIDHQLKELGVTIRNAMLQNNTTSTITWLTLLPEVERALTALGYRLHNEGLQTRISWDYN